MNVDENWRSCRRFYGKEASRAWLGGAVHIKSRIAGERVLGAGKEDMQG